MVLEQLCADCLRLTNARLIQVDNTPRPGTTATYPYIGQASYGHQYPPVESPSRKIITCIFQDRDGEGDAVTEDPFIWHIEDAGHILASRHLPYEYRKTDSLPKSIIIFTQEKLIATRAHCHLCFLLYDIFQRSGNFYDVSFKGGSIGVPMLHAASEGWAEYMDSDSHAGNIHQTLRNFLFSGETARFSFMIVKVEQFSGFPKTLLQIRRPWKLKVVLSDQHFATPVHFLRALSDEDELRYGFRVNTITEVREWLGECVRSHPRCIPAAGKPEARQLPTRLLKLSAGLKDEVNIQLVETKAEMTGQSADVSYATLSHCWGKRGIPNKLVRSNLALHLQTRSAHSLPETLKQAVRFCYAIGIELLWIDALCIIQDDSKDWEHEAARMFSVYAGGVLNIAATGASDSSEGLLVQKHFAMPCRILSSWFGNSDKSLELLISFSDTTVNYWSESQPLYARGWVYQERVLSKRRIDFTTEQIKWQCRRNACGEQYGNGFDINPRGLTRSLLDGAPEWESVITNYSGTQLTHYKDRLAAIAGVAQAYTIERGFEPTEYIAGLMRERLIPQLLWTLRYPTSLLEETKVAPTWSWASVSSQVLCNTHGVNKISLHPKIQVTGVNLHSIPDNPFNHIRQGWLQLKAPTMCFCESVARYNETAGSLELGDLAYSGQPEKLELVQDSGICVAYVLKQTFGGKEPVIKDSIPVVLSYEIRWDHDESLQRMLHSARVFFLAVQVERKLPNMFNKEYRCTYTGLCLRKVNGQRGIYERLGLLIIESQFPEISLWGENGPIGLEEEDLIGEAEKTCEDPEIRIV